ncbi:cytochrome c maturation protein A [Gammaproteobacteria bacterium]
MLFADLSFELHPGQALVLEGRNGAGKTSLLRILCGIRLPEAGEVRWQGEDIFQLGPAYHEQIAYLGHKDGHKLDLTPLENLRMAQGLNRACAGTTLTGALREAGLQGFEDVPTRTLSAGQQRRLAIARLWVTEAALWVLDEPFTSLDRQGIQVVESLIAGHLVAGGLTAMTTHHRVSLDAQSLLTLDLSRR